MRVPEYLVCPITNTLMEDPVVTVDGFSYERRAIEQWLLSSDVSPLTGYKLVSTVVIPNVNLHKAILLYQKEMLAADQASDIISVFPPNKKTQEMRIEQSPYAYLSDEPDTLSAHLKGGIVSINGRVVSRTVTEASGSWYNTVVFVERPVKVYGVGNYFVLEILETVTQWGGLVLGLTTVDFRQQQAQSRVIDEYSYYLDSQGWLHCPDSSSTLCDWHAGTLSVGSFVTVTLPDDGRFIVTVDGKTKVDVLPEIPIPQGPLFPFVACFGACKSLRLIEP
jgi:hypothetical protein